MNWKPASLTWVERHLKAELNQLHPKHRIQLEALLVSPYEVPIEAHPGETVIVVAEYRGKALYWSDVEDGWEFEPLSASGGISERGSSQFDLGHISHQLFGNHDL